MKTHLIIKPFCKNGHSRNAETVYDNGACIECTHNRYLRVKPFLKPANKEYLRDYYKKNKEEQYFRFIKRTYGISKEAFIEMRDKQNNLCALCGNVSNGVGRLHVDHNHTTGKVRGLLCHTCNTLVIPAIEKYTHLISQAKEYLGRKEC